LQTPSRTFKLCVGNKKLLVNLTLTANLLNNQITKPKTRIQWIALLAAVMLLAAPLGIFGVQMVRASDPYVKNVLSLKGDIVQGNAIFQINCAGCHGLEADGLVGPSLQGVSKRKSRYKLIHQVISGETPPMPKFQPSAQEMADLLSYLENL
jgi:mono/diheme cytochrome c family protein